MIRGQKRLINGLHDIFGSELGTLLLIGGGATLGLAIENGLAILVHGNKKAPPTLVRVKVSVAW